MLKSRRRGFLPQIVKLIVLCVVMVYLLAAITSPWAFHIGGRWTPLLYWSGSGKLLTSSGTHTLFLTLLPAPDFSHLRLDGLRPTGGLQGSGRLCTGEGRAEYLRLSGTIYNGWRSTDGSLIELRLLEQKAIDVGQDHGYFDLYGRWQGQELVTDDRGEPGSKFQSGLNVEHASVKLHWIDGLHFGNPCANAFASR